MAEWRAKLNIGLAELMDVIGKVGYLRAEGFMFPVLIQDVRISFGRKEFRVLPQGGTGSKWVSADRVEIP